MLPDGTIESLIQAHNNLSVNAGKGNKIATILFFTGEAGLGAAAMGGINGRFATPGQDHLQVFGAPVDLTLGAILLGSALFGVYGATFDTHVAAIGAGCIGAYAYRKALEKSAEARVEADVGRAMLAEGGVNARVSRNSANSEKKVVHLVTK